MLQRLAHAQCLLLICLNSAPEIVQSPPTFMHLSCHRLVIVPILYSFVLSSLSKQSTLLWGILLLLLGICFWKNISQKLHNQIAAFLCRAAIECGCSKSPIGWKNLNNIRRQMVLYFQGVKLIVLMQWPWGLGTDVCVERIWTLNPWTGIHYECALVI